MRKKSLFALAALFVLSACEGFGPQRVDVTRPTVTYRYYGDPYGPQLDEVAQRAERDCRRSYGLRARLADVDREGDTNYATFACD